jgi:acetyl-CoA C-acetyltransferase
MNQHMLADVNLMKKKPEIYWNMLQTAEQVAKRYNISAASAWTLTARQANRKPVPLKRLASSTMRLHPITVQAGVVDKVMGMMTKQVTVSADEGLREGTTVERVSGIKPAMPGGVVVCRQRQPIFRRRRCLCGDERRACRANAV